MFALTHCVRKIACTAVSWGAAAIMYCVCRTAAGLRTFRGKGIRGRRSHGLMLARRTIPQWTVYLEAQADPGNILDTLCIFSSEEHHFCRQAEEPTHLGDRRKAANMTPRIEVFDTSRDKLAFTEEEDARILAKIQDWDANPADRPPRQYQKIAMDMQKEELTVRMRAFEKHFQRASVIGIDLMGRCEGQPFLQREIDLIVAWRQQGVSAADIAQRLLRSSGTVAKKISRYLRERVTDSLRKAWTQEEDLRLMQAMHPDHPSGPLTLKQYQELNKARSLSAYEHRSASTKLMAHPLMQPGMYNNLCAALRALQAQPTQPNDALARDVMTLLAAMDVDYSGDENGEAGPVSRHGGKDRRDRRSDSPPPDAGASRKRRRTPPGGGAAAPTTKSVVQGGTPGGGASGSKKAQGAPRGGGASGSKGTAQGSPRGGGAFRSKGTIHGGGTSQGTNSSDTKHPAQGGIGFRGGGSSGSRGPARGGSRGGGSSGARSRGG